MPRHLLRAAVLVALAALPAGVASAGGRCIYGKDAAGRAASRVCLTNPRGQADPRAMTVCDRVVDHRKVSAWYRMVDDKATLYETAFAPSKGCISEIKWSPIEYLLLCVQPGYVEVIEKDGIETWKVRNAKWCTRWTHIV
jgi:hypothetical protein